MKKLLQTEELAQFILGIYLFYGTDYQWWWFLVLILLPDLSMLGYLINTKIGAYSYNFFHHKLLGIFLLILGNLLLGQTVYLAGIILFSHAAMDRIFGYGLKYTSSFHDTHLGKIGK